MKTQTTRRRAVRRMRGFSLMDGLMSMAILSFGLLGMSRLQARALAQATEGMQRTTAAQYADEIIGSALVDTANVACYQWPVAGVCGSATAKDATADWRARLIAAMPSGSVTSTYDSAAGRLKVVVNWAGKQTTDTHTLEATTDVR